MDNLNLTDFTIKPLGESNTFQPFTLEVKDFNLEPFAVDAQNYNFEPITIPSSHEVTFEINSPDISHILFDQITAMPDTYDIEYGKIIQARKHKKKRINKKWLKRYGYKTVMVKSKGWKIHTCKDGSFEFIK